MIPRDLLDVGWWTSNVLKETEDAGSCGEPRLCGQLRKLAANAVRGEEALTSDPNRQRTPLDFLVTRRLRRGKALVYLLALAFLNLLGACTPPAASEPVGGERVGRDTTRTSPTQPPEHSPTPSRSRSPAAPGPSLTATATHPAPGKVPGYLRSAGSRLVDPDGREVILTGVNWFGMETGTYAPHGLWARNWQEMLDQIDQLGYNLIRLPYCNQVLDPNSRPLEGIDFRLNPDLKKLNGQDIMDKIVEGAGTRGIKIILDRHRPTPSGQSKLWYTDDVPEEEWIADWQALARRYRHNDTVIGADLHNEPAGDATWGTGDVRTDWRLAAERAGNAILEVNPDWLIVVEGIEKHENDWYWMGGNLLGAAKAPVRLSLPDKLVYSAHDYGPGVFNQRWFQAKEFPSNLPALWDAHWGYLVKQGIAPVLLGEFGGRSVGDDAEGVWHRTLLDYLQRNRISYAYWSLNPNSGDTGGILDDDWKAVHTQKQALLATYQAPKLRVVNASRIDTSVAAAPRKKPLPEQQLRALFRTGHTEPLTDVLSIEIQVLNETESRVPLEELALSYWLAAPGLGPSDQVLSVDWCSVERDRLRVELLPDARAGQTHRIDVSFGKGSGMLGARSAAEIKLRLKRHDQGRYNQADSFSFQPTTGYGDNDRIALYLWGDRIWGREPSEVGA